MMGKNYQKIFEKRVEKKGLDAFCILKKRKMGLSMRVHYCPGLVGCV
jgi:hypothetical protein